MQPDHSLLISGTAKPDTLYRVLASDLLAGPYIEINTVLTDDTGYFRYVDLDAARHDSRFYRLVCP